MAGQFTRLQKSYRIDATNVNPVTSKNEIPMYRIVTMSGEDLCKLPAADNATPLGVVDNDERLDDVLHGGGGSQVGRQVAVKLEGIASIVLDGPVAVGDRVIAKAGGFGIKIPAAAGSYEVVGFAEKAGVAGDVIAVRMSYHIKTV